MSSISHTLQYYFKMVSPTSTFQEISMNKQAIFEDRTQILLFLRGLRIVLDFWQFRKMIIGARTMDLQESRLNTVNP
jgi:hypothetical protein